MKINIRKYRCILISNRKRINHKGEEERIKDQSYMRRGYTENLNFFNNLNLIMGEELQLQRYNDDPKNGGEWLTLNKRTQGKGVQEVNA